MELLPGIKFGKTCRVQKLCDPPLPSIGYFIVQEVVKVFLVASPFLCHRLVSEIG